MCIETGCIAYCRVTAELPHPLYFCNVRMYIHQRTGAMKLFRLFKVTARARHWSQAPDYKSYHDLAQEAIDVGNYVHPIHL